MSYKPLSEDDGNWFYLPVFWKRGVRLYKNYSLIYGYFGFSQIASKIYNSLGFEKLSFFYFFKSVWYALTAVSIYLLSLFLGHDYVLAFVAGMLFLIVSAVPNTLFVLTYGEHFFILPINLSIIFTYYGLVTGNLWHFTLAGLMSAWAVQMKPTALLFGILLPTVFYFTPDIYLPLGSYVITFGGLSLLPLIILNNKKSQEKYFLMTFAPIISFFVIILDYLKLAFLTKYIPENLRIHDPYIENHHNKSLQIQWVSFKKYMFPAIKDLYLILMLAVAQVGFLFVNFDPFVFSMILLCFIFLLTQQFQKNYYTPHFNPIWAPLSILSAKTIVDVWPDLFRSGVLGWIVIFFMGIESAKIVRKIVKTFSEKQRDTFGYTQWGIFYRMAETIGTYVQQHSAENDRLFVWGDQPSIYLYAQREIFDTDFFFPYSNQGRIVMEGDLLRSLRANPPEMILFFNYKVNDGWNMRRLQDTIGVCYNPVKKFDITDDEGNKLQRLEDIVLDFSIYRRDDARFKELLMERAGIARENGDLEEAAANLNKILDLFPEDFDASTRLQLMRYDGDEGGGRRYLIEQLSVHQESAHRSILLRHLADLESKTGDVNRAMKTYADALHLNPKDPKLYNARGEIYFSSGNIEKAFQAFKSALELNPYSADTLNNMGVVLANIGKKKEAVNFFTKAHLFMPSHSDARNNLKALGCFTGKD